MTGVVTWSANATFSNAAGGSTNVFTIPQQSLTDPANARAFFAFAGKGGQSGVWDHQVRATYSDLSTALLQQTIDRVQSGDEFAGMVALGWSLNGTKLNAGATTIAVITLHASPSAPEFGVIAMLLVDGAFTPVGASPFGDAEDGSGIGNFSGNFTWGGSPQGSNNIYPQYIVASYTSFVHTATPALPDWAGAANWTNIQQARTSDGRGLGQGDVALGFYTLPASIPDPVPWLLTAPNPDVSDIGFSHLDMPLTSSPVILAQSFVTMVG